MPSDNSPSTPERILQAATTEFAAHGLAGARVDRIATRAQANKQRVYAYFTSKEQLFDAVVEHAVVHLLDGVPFDADDLPRYAIALARHYRSEDHLVPLLLWHSLERPGVLWELEPSRTSMAAKVAAVRAAQARGVVARHLDPASLTELIVGLVTSTMLRPGNDEQWAARENSLATAIRRLTED